MKTTSIKGKATANNIVEMFVNKDDFDKVMNYLVIVGDKEEKTKSGALKSTERIFENKDDAENFYNRNKKL